MVAALHLYVTSDLEVCVALDGALVGAANHIVQAATTAWIDVAGCGNYHVSAADRGPVSAAIKCIA